MPEIDVSFVINCFKRPERIRRLIDSIFGSNIALTFEVVAITYDLDCSGVREYLLDQQKKRSVKVIVNKKDVGKAESRNQGIRSALGKYVYILDDDTEINGDAIVGIYDFMESHPRCGISSPKLLNGDGTVQASARKFPTLVGKLLRNLKPPLAYVDDLYPDYNRTFKVDYLIGASQFIRAGILKKIGDIDPASGKGVEDIEICAMVWKIGFEVWYIHDVQIYHHQSYAIKNEFFSRKTLMHLSSIVYFFRKWGYFLSRESIYKKLHIFLAPDGLIE